MPSPRDTLPVMHTDIPGGPVRTEGEAEAAEGDEGEGGEGVTVHTDGSRSDEAKLMRPAGVATARRNHFGNGFPTLTVLTRYAAF